MVHRAPVRGGASKVAFDEPNDSVRSSTSGGPPRGLEWSLRSLHKIDTSAQHFLNNYYNDTVESFEDDDEDDIMEDQTAYEIFKTKDNDSGKKNGAAPGKSGDSVWATLNAPLRTGVVDGKKVVFELLTNVNQKPFTSRKERLQRSHVLVNSATSHWEFRLRFLMLKFSILWLALLFLGAFVLMNVLFALVFYYSGPDHCCGDSNLSFEEIFAFCVQTSTTIGYGGFSPVGHISHFLVVCLSYLSTLMNTLFAGLLFTKFVTPVINIQFSDVFTICNVNGVPCLSFRLGNADGNANPLTDINVTLTYSFQIPYTDHKGNQQFFRQTEELKLLSNRQHGLSEAWTLRHVIDESSPLFGIHFEEHPGNKIYVFTLSVDAVQELTKSTVNVQTDYALEDIMIGHAFTNMVTFDEDAKVATSDFAKISETEPSPVWYPSRTGAYGIDKLL